MLIILFQRISVLSLCVLCRAYARKKGRNNVTVDDLIHVITPKGRGQWSFLPLDFFFRMHLEFFSQISICQNIIHYAPLHDLSFFAYYD